MSLSPETLESAARTLIGRLQTTRERMAGRSEEDLRQALALEVRASLAGLSPLDADRATATARELVALEMRAREASASRPMEPDPADLARFAELEARVRHLEAENERLTRVNGSLSASVASASEEAAKRASPMSGGSLARVRQALAAIARQHDAPLAGFALDSEEHAFVLATAHLLRFAQDTKSAMSLLLADYRLGPAAAMSSVMISNTAREVPERFGGALRGDTEAARALGATLDTCRSELTSLNEAFATCIPRGARLLLKDLDPAPIAAERKTTFGGVDEQRAWSDYVRLHGDLKALGPGEVWERFFHPALQQHLTGGGRLPNPPAPAEKPERAPRRKGPRR